MAEHDADREPQPIDEDAAWAAIVAGYGEEPADPPGAKPFKSVDGLAVLEGERNRTKGADTEQGGTPESEGPESEGPEPESPAAEVPPAAAPEGVKPPLGGSVVFAPGVGGPRDYALDEPHDDGIDDDDDDGEGHFVPPEPPPLPEADVTTRFAWLAVIGGPLLMLIVILLQWDMTWWLTTLSIGGFLGGFATLVARMQHDEDDDHDDPGRGAVV